MARSSVGSQVLYGQARALTVVREFMERPKQGRSLRSRNGPVLIFTGGRGAGKTALLTTLESLLDQRVPYARVDFETSDAAASHEILSALAFDLNRHCATYGRLAFPRFVVGRIAMAQSLDLTSRQIARKQIEAALEAHRNIPQLRQFLRDLGPEIVAAVPGAKTVPGSGVVIRHLPDLLLNGLRSWPFSRQVVLGEGQSWYGHQDRGLRRDSLDVLVDLNRWARRPDMEDNRSALDEMLLAAFLADLRLGFGRSWGAPYRSLNCVVLLDNADGPVGLAFLMELVRARRLHATHAPDDPDPVTVVATSRGPLLTRIGADGERVVEGDEASLDDANRPAAGQVRRWWYPVALRLLTEDEVGNMVAALGLQRGSERRISARIYRFTRGHPGATRLLLDAIAEQPDGPNDLWTLLRRREPAELGSSTVRERLEARQLEGFPQEGSAIEDLVTCSAARDFAEASRLAGGGLIADSSPAFTTDLWTDDDVTGSRAMQPMLRRLLLLRLAARDEDHPASWSRIHSLLSKQAEQAGDDAGFLYHELARGQLEAVTRDLVDRLHEPSAGVAAWLDLVRSATAAPAPFEPPSVPRKCVQELLAFDAPRDSLTTAVASLVAALWVDADPLVAGGRAELHEIAISAYQQLMLLPNGQAAFTAELGRHRALAEQWR